MRVNIGMPVVRTDARSRDYQIFLEWVDIFTHGAPPAHFARGAPLSICKRFSKASHRCEGKMCGLSLLAISSGALAREARLRSTMGK